jgi:WD40 repeat protein
MAAPIIPPCLFLSHSGADTDAARELKRRLLDSPDARAAGLKVWLDKDDLAAGVGWQIQLEKAIGEEATSFAVHVGAKGIVNWVESEVRLGLSRANSAADFPFIPILSKECLGSAALPPFARQYQGIHDPLNDSDEFVKLLRAVLRRAPRDKAVVLDSPFVGLKAMAEADADRFFGRSEEIAALVAKLKRHRLIAIVADSGAGKSSLAQAGLIPAFRGGALSDTASREPDDRIWHVVVTRPRRDPIEGLKRGVTEAAERLGRSPEQCAALRTRIDPADPSETAYAIRCDLPVGKTETLLIVDQFEELLTETGHILRAPFVDLLMALEAATGFQIVLTLRADHFNLCRPFSNLFEHVTRDGEDAVLRLRRITDKGIVEAVRRPLRLAGLTDDSEQDAVIASIRRDISDRAGDLALVQMALYAMWQKHRADGVNLLVAYSQVGGVVGALAHEAEHVRTHRLDAPERLLLSPLFIRLVRLGETGGATRRAADLDDFDGRRRSLAARLATEDCGRLLLAGEKSIEVAHEALITQWPWLQNTLNDAAADMRVLDRLMDRARRWNTTGSRGTDHLATGAERAEFAALIECHGDWPSSTEREFVAASDQDERRKQRDAGRRKEIAYAGVAAFILVLVTGLIGVWWQFQEAIHQRNETMRLQSLYLAAQANKHVEEGDPGTAMLLALEALPDMASGRERPLVPEAQEALFRAHQDLRESVVFKGHSESLWNAKFAPGDGRLVVTASEDKTARLWNTENGDQLAILKGHEEAVRLANFSPDGRYLITASTDKTARLWTVKTGEPSAAPLRHDKAVRSAAFSPDSQRVVTSSDDNTARVWDVQTGKQIAILQGHTKPVRVAVFSHDGRRVMTASDDTTVRLWETKMYTLVHVLEGHTKSVRSAGFSHDSRHAITTSLDNTARVWDVQTGQPTVVFQGHGAPVLNAAFSLNDLYAATASEDKTARVWDVRTAQQMRVLGPHGGAVESVSFSPNGHHVVTASDATARIWDADTGELVTILNGHRGPVRSAEFSPDGAHILTASDDGTARLWSAGALLGQSLALLMENNGPLRGAVFIPDGRRVLTISDDNTLRLWDPKTGQQVVVLDKLGGKPVTPVLSPDGRLVVTTSDDNTAIVWNVNTGEHQAILQGHSALVSSAAFSPDGQRVVTASRDKTARVWDAQTGRQIAALRGHNEPVWSAAFSPDGFRVVTASGDTTARLWNAESGDLIAQFEGHLGPVYNAVFSPNGQRIVTAGADNASRVWDVRTHKTTAVLRGHTRSVFSGVFSPDGQRIATASDDGTARIWDVQTGKTTAVLAGHAGTVWSAGFSPDGQRVVTASDDGTARIWRIFPTAQALVELSKKVVPRCLTSEQRAENFLDSNPTAWCRTKWPFNGTPQFVAHRWSG